MFSKWNDGELSSYLIEITSKILAKKDDITSKGEVVDYVSHVETVSGILINTACFRFTSIISLLFSLFLYLQILDKTGMKGTGRWTVQEAAEQSVAAPTIAASLDSRYLSARKDERLKASKILKGPTEMPSVSKEQVRIHVFTCIHFAKTSSFPNSLHSFCVLSPFHS